MPRAVSACRRRRRATHESPLRISLFVGAPHGSPCFSRPAAEKGDPWVAPTNISLRRGAACLALFQHAVGGEGRPWVAPTNISLFVGARHASRCFSMPAAEK